MLLACLQEPLQWICFMVMLTLQFYAVRILKFETLSHNFLDQTIIH